MVSRVLPRLPLPPLPIRRAGRNARRLIARRPWVYWLAIGGLASWAYAVAGAHTGAADRARDEWGATTPVLVATSDIASGDTLAGAVTTRDWPAALAPPGALGELPDDAVARQRVAAGDIVSTVDVTAAGALALVPAGWLAVPVTESPRSGATAGDRVQVASEGVVIAADARVVGMVDADVTLVAVPAGDAPLLPLAADNGALTLLRPP